MTSAPAMTARCRCPPTTRPGTAGRTRSNAPVFFCCVRTGSVPYCSRRVPLQVCMFVVLVFLATAMSVFWSAFIDGPMYDFNGNYFYAIAYLIYLLPLIVVSLAAQRAPHWIWIRGMVAACVVALLAITVARKPVYNWTAPSDAFNRDLARLIDGAPIVHLSIDLKVWTSGFGVVTAVDRLGVKFTVDYGYRFLTGERPTPSIEGISVPTLQVSAASCSGGVQVPYDGREKAFVCRR